MFRSHCPRPLLLALVLLLPAPAFAGDIVSTMRNVSAVSESRGFYLSPAVDRSGAVDFGSLAPIQAFELVRPGMSAVTIGRLHTSCSCVQVSAPKRTFARGERVILELKNVVPTPPAGQMYAIYVQVTSPIRATLRFDTFVQSSQFVPQPEPEPLPEVAETVEPAAGGADEPQMAGAAEEAEKTPEEEAMAGDEAPAPRGKVEQRISLITLGVSDLSRARIFYESLGWKAAPAGKYDSIVFFQLHGMVLALYPMTELLRDQNQEASAFPGGITLGINVRSREEVEATYNAFIDAGGKSLKAPEEMPWGSVTGYAADPDGNPWEISWVPQMQVDGDGDLWIK